MKWKSIVLWVVLELSVFFATSLLAGLVFGLLKEGVSASPVVRALGGMVVPFLFFIRFFPIIAAVFIVPVLVWSFIACRFPALEANRALLACSLGLFALVVGGVVWYFFPFDRPLAYWAAFMTTLSIVLPRFLTAKLTYGIFAI
jgi:hypothetical protein